LQAVDKNIFRQSAPMPYPTASLEPLSSQTGLRRGALIDWAAIAVVALAAAAVVAWLSAMDFPLGTQPDEPSKVRAVLMGPSRDLHPILMIQLARAANFFLGLTDPQSVVELGRAFSALAGGALIVATFCLARLVLPASAAVAAAAATLATPLITVHARYFKEDIFVAPFIVLALVALLGALRAPRLMRVVALGAAIGMAGASKYVGGVLLLLYALPVLIAFGPGQPLTARATNAGMAAIVAFAVFALIDLPALLAGHQFRTDLRAESVHALSGHTDIVLPITLTWGIFHLRESLWPGLGAPLTILGVLGLASPIVASGERRLQLAVIAGFAVLWYFAHEISPLKPYPDYARYMVPLAPLLVVLGAAFVNELAERRYAGLGAAAALSALLLAALPAWSMSLRVNGRGDDDPRRLLPGILANAPGRVAIDGYSGYEHRSFLARRNPLPAAGNTNFIVTSTFNYERYERYAMLPQQSPRTRAAARFFAQALALPHLDISNGRPSFGFFNPTTTVIVLDGRAERLLPIAKMLEAAAPSLIVQWNRPMPLLAMSQHSTH
jgi:hypothetical protein